MLNQSALADFYPVIMTPSHDGKYFHNYTLSLLNTIHYFATQGWPLQVYLQRGESLITRARNNCVASFLQHSEWTHLFWIDSDIGFSLEAFERLLLADRDITAGIYPLKKESWPSEGLAQGTTQTDFERCHTRYTINTSPQEGENDITLRVDADGFMEVDEAPTGFMCIKREVFDKMVAAYPDLQYISDSDYSSENGFHYRFFDCFVDPKSQRYLSEDYAFCRLWQKIGGKIHVDVQSNLTHQGTKVYTGSFADSLQANIAHAVFAPKGTPMTLEIEGSIKANERGPS